MSVVADYPGDFFYSGTGKHICPFRTEVFKYHPRVSGSYCMGLWGVWRRLVAGEKTNWLEARLYPVLPSQTYRF